MKKLFVTALLCALPIFAVAQLSDVPNEPKLDARYLIYLHGVGIENVGVAKADEDYRGIVKAFEEQGFIVISEVRWPNTKPNEYGRKVAGQVKALIAKGVPPDNINVVGYSKGGMIALMAAAEGDNQKVNYVILAGCWQKGKQFYDIYANKVAPSMKGRILSMYDAADRDFGTCQDFFAAAGDKVTAKEIKFETGQGHGLFSKATAQWVSPISDWATVK